MCVSIMCYCVIGGGGEQMEAAWRSIWCLTKPASAALVEALGPNLSGLVKL